MSGGRCEVVDRSGDTPPFAPLRALVARLEDAGIVCALGGSGLLIALGLAGRANDWDLTTDAPREQLEPLVADLGFEPVGPGGVHADQKLVFPGLRIECILGFSIRAGAGVVRIPTRVAGRWRGVPLASPEAWAVAYALLGREAKADLLFAHLAERGADPAAVGGMLGEPLPAGLAARLRALRPRGGGGPAGRS